jgi:hypothetical protein
MQGERRKYLRWRKMVLKAKSRVAGPLFVAWKRLTKAQHHYNTRLKKIALLEWRVK